jgi:hypothetical protein
LEVENANKFSDKSGFYNLADLLAEKAGTGKAKPLDLRPWRNYFKSPSEMEKGELQFLVKDFLPEGICFLGGLSGCGKTWLALSLAKALCTGQRFLGHFEVPEKVPVLYLTPENGERPFHSRLERFGIPEDMFLCRTMNDGDSHLRHESLLAAVHDLLPVVILDTAVRFLQGSEENSASDNAKGFSTDIFTLLKAGAKAVIGLHHAPKNTANVQEMTLENTLRGTGDFGAMADTVYGLRCINQDDLVIKVSCVKARDFEPVSPFRIQGRPYINEKGDFGMLVGSDAPKETAETQKLIVAIQENPDSSIRTLAKKTGISRGRIPALAATLGLRYENKKWTQPEDDLATSGLVN